jgi:hypothetical protein
VRFWLALPVFTDAPTVCLGGLVYRRRLLLCYVGLNRGVFTVDWSPASAKLAVGGGDLAIRVIDVLGLDGENN